jgi:hypothetical protein
LAAEEEQAARPKVFEDADFVVSGEAEAAALAEHNRISMLEVAEANQREAEKKKNEDEVQSQMAQMSAMLKNLTSESSSGPSVPPETYHEVIMTIPKTLHPCRI